MGQISWQVVKKGDKTKYLPLKAFKLNGFPSVPNKVEFRTGFGTATLKKVPPIGAGEETVIAAWDGVAGDEIRIDNPITIRENLFIFSFPALRPLLTLVEVSSKGLGKRSPKANKLANF